MWGATDNGADAFTVGPAVQIRFQESDLSILETHPLTPGLTLTSSGFFLSTSLTLAVASSSSTTVSLLGPAAGDVATSTPTPELISFTSVSAGVPIIETSTVSQVISNYSNPSTMASTLGLENQDSLETGLVVVVVSALIATFAATIYVLYRARRSHEKHWWAWVPFAHSFAMCIGLGDRARTAKPASDEEALGHTNLKTIPQVHVSELENSMVNPIHQLEIDKMFGSKENPAELEADQSQHLSARASWISRMLSWVALSSTASTRSSSRSRWTQRSLTNSGDWETFIQEKTERASHEPSVLTTFEAVRAQSASYINDDGRPVEKLGSLMELQKMRSFDRLSQGTFGKVIVRGRSPGSTRGNATTPSSNGLSSQST